MGFIASKPYLIRSTSCPFQVEIRGYITDMIYRNETFDTLLQTSGRWVSLLLEYEESQTLLLLMPLRDKLPTLQHLFIMCSKNI
jgi:phosphoribosyl 1,2-cyclic phosphodiesterase